MSAALSNQIVGDRRAFGCGHEADGDPGGFGMVVVSPMTTAMGLQEKKRQTTMP